MNEKTCCSCREALPLSAFGHDQHRKDGLRARCRECENQNQRDRVRAKKNAQVVSEVHAHHAQMIPEVHAQHAQIPDVQDHTEALTKLRRIATSNAFGPKLRSFLTTLLGTGTIDPSTVLAALEVTFPEESKAVASPASPKIIPGALSAPEEPQGDGGAYGFAVAAALRQLGTWPKTAEVDAWA